MLTNSRIANAFLASYKAILAEVNDGERPQDTDEYVECRDLLYSDLVSIAECKSISDDFKDALGKAIYGQFIYLKKYKNWYAFKHLDTNRYFAALGLTSPIEEMVEEFSLIETALVPYQGIIVCDGLIVNKNVLLGPNMMKECRDGYHQARKSGNLIREI